MFLIMEISFFTRLRFASPRMQNDNLYSAPPHKNIFFKGLIKYFAHNHPHITTIVNDYMFKTILYGIL